MWWIWLVPSLVVAGAAAMLGMSVVDTLRRLRAVRRRLAELTADAERARAVVATVTARDPDTRAR